MRIINGCTPPLEMIDKDLPSPPP